MGVPCTHYDSNSTVLSTPITGNFRPFVRSPPFSSDMLALLEMWRQLAREQRVTITGRTDAVGYTFR